MSIWRLVMTILSLFFVTELNAKPTDVRIKKREKKYLDKLEQVVNQVEGARALEVQEQFYIFANSELDHSEIIFIGEQHTDITGRINGLSIIHKYYRPGDSILIEGFSGFHSSYCAGLLYSELLGGINYLKALGRKVSKYHPAAAEKYALKFPKLTSLASVLRKEQILSRVPFKDCFGWDIEQDLHLSEYLTYENIRMRNKSMVNHLKERREHSNKIFVQAGIGHLFLVDYLRYGASAGYGFEEFFKLALMKQSADDLILKSHSFAGSTVDIFQYVKSEIKRFSILIPRSINDAILKENLAMMALLH